MLALGVDLGGTNIKIGLVDENFNLTSQATFKTPPTPERVIDEVYHYYSSLPVKITIAGLGVPGPVDISRSFILRAVNIPTWKNVPLKKLLQKRLGIPVVMENDANIAAWAEYKCGKAKKLI